MNPGSRIATVLGLVVFLATRASSLCLPWESEPHDGGGEITIKGGGNGGDGGGANPVAACCLPGGQCSVLSQEECVSSGGTHLPSQTACTPYPCGTASNQDGILLLHANPAIVYTVDNEGYSGASGLADCSAAITSVTGTDTKVFFALAAFAPASSVHLSGITFGVSYDMNAIVLEDWGTDATFELASGNWPESGGGTALTWSTAKTAALNEVYWFAAYNYYGAPTQFSLAPHPVQGANFADDSVPAVVTPISCLGSLGFEQAGMSCPCGTTGPQKLTRAQAIALVTAGVIEGSPYESSMVGFLHYPSSPDSTLYPGTTIADWDSTFSLNLTQESYLCWLDNEPNEEWLHSSTFVTVDAYSGALTVNDSRSWPMINGQETLLMQDGNDHPGKFRGQYQGTPVQFDYTLVDRPNTSDWAIIVVGKNLTGAGEAQARGNDLRRVQKILNGVALGPRIDKDNIQSVAGADALGATIEEICAALDAVKNEACAKFYFVYLGHGSTSGTVADAAVGNKSDTFKWSKLAQKLLELKAKEICCILESCHSGAAIQAIADAEKKAGVGGKIKLKGGVITSSSASKTTPRTDFDGTPFIKGLCACWADPSADLNLDGKVTMFESLAWAKSQDPSVALPNPQGRTLGDGRDVDFQSCRRVECTSGADHGGALRYEAEVVTYRIKKKAGVAKSDSIVTRTRLYVVNPQASTPHRGVNSVQILCVKGSGSPEVLHTFTPLLAGGERKCLLDIPRECKKVSVRATPTLVGGEHDGDPRQAALLTSEISLDSRTTYYNRGEFIFQEYEFVGIPGHDWMTEATGPAGWTVGSDPLNLVVPAMMDTQTVIVSGELPALASTGAELLLDLFNLSGPDTLELGIDALLFDRLSTSVDDGSIHRYAALDCYAPLASDGSGVQLENCVMSFRSDAVCMVEETGALSAIQTAIRADSGRTCTFEVRGDLEWDRSSLVDFSSGMRLIAPSGRLYNAWILKSRGDGLYLQGDLANLGVDFCVVDSSTGHGLVVDGVSNALLENLDIEHSAGMDVVAVNASHVEYRDGSFVHSKLQIEQGSQLERTWTTHFVAIGADDAPLDGASVEVRDLGGTLVGSSLTNAGGFSEKLVLTEYVRVGAAETAHTPHMVTLAFAGWDTTFAYSADAERNVEVPSARTNSGSPGPDDPSIPDAFELSGVYPNPSNGSTVIKFGLPTSVHVTISLFDAQGREVRTLLRGPEPAGSYARTVRLGGLPSGVYFVELRAAGYRAARKVLLR